MAVRKDLISTGAGIAGCDAGDVEVAVRVETLLRRREFIEFLSGALSGAMSNVVLAPLETVRTRMIVGVGSKNIAGSFAEIVGEHGWRGLWAGTTVAVLRAIPRQAVERVTYECIKRTLSPPQELPPPDATLAFSSWLSPAAVAGAIAGVASTLLCHPLDVLKDRMTVHQKAYPTISIAMSKIYQEDGIAGLYAGVSPTLIGMLPFSACHYFVYEAAKKAYCRSCRKDGLSHGEMLIIGAISGFVANTAGFPFEVARKRMMVGSSAHGGRPASMAAAMAEVVGQEGLLGLYRGWGLSSMKAMPASGITWMLYEMCKDVMLLDKPHFC